MWGEFTLRNGTKESVQNSNGKSWGENTLRNGKKRESFAMVKAFSETIHMRHGVYCRKKRRYTTFYGKTDQIG